MCSRQWFQARKREFFYRLAKTEKYRSRAVYKLKFINEKYDIIRPGDTVLDLGAAPGGWSQLAKQLAGIRGLVIGVDIQKIAPIEGVIFIRGDITDEKTVDAIIAALIESDRNKVDVIISDMAPKISGNYSIDHARSVELVEEALKLAGKLLKQDGNFVAKVFQGDMYESLISKFRLRFEFCKAFKSKASRAQSSEIYIIGKGFKANVTA